MAEEGSLQQDRSDLGRQDCRKGTDVEAEREGSSLLRSGRREVLGEGAAGEEEGSRCAEGEVDVVEQEIEGGEEGSSRWVCSKVEREGLTGKVAVGAEKGEEGILEVRSERRMDGHGGEEGSAFDEEEEEGAKEDLEEEGSDATTRQLRSRRGEEVGEERSSWKWSWGSWSPRQSQIRTFWPSS